MRASLRRCLVASQGVYFGCLAIDVGLHPGYLFARNEGGVSNFGVHAETVVPFSVGFLGCAALLAAAARRVPAGPEGRWLAVALRSIAVALVAVCASTYPYQHGAALHALHLAVGAAAMLLEGAVAVGLAARRRGTLDAALAGLALGALVLAACASAGVLRALFVAQVLLSAATGALLVRAATGPVARTAAG